MADPAAARARLAGFLGVAVPDASVPGQHARPGQAIVGSWEWWKARALQPVAAARSEAWRSWLSPSDAAVITEAAAPEMARFEYLGGPGACRSRPRFGAPGRDRLAARLCRMRRFEALSCG